MLVVLMCVISKIIYSGDFFNQGFNSTITATVEAPRRDQIKESKLGLHSGIKEPLATLCSDPNTDVVILSGSKRDTLEEVSLLPSCMPLGRRLS